MLAANSQGASERSDVFGISPNSSPREVALDAAELKLLEKLSVALSTVSFVTSDVCRRRSGRMSLDIVVIKQRSSRSQCVSIRNAQGT